MCIRDSLQGGDGIAWTADGAGIWFSQFFPDGPLLVDFQQGVLSGGQQAGPPCYQLDIHKTLLVCANRRLPESYFPEVSALYLDTVPSRTMYVNNPNAIAPGFGGYPPR